jgi:hypothetical protein
VVGGFVNAEVEGRGLRDTVRSRTDSGESGSLERSCRDQVCFCGVVDTFDVEHCLCLICAIGSELYARIYVSISQNFA